MDDNTRQFKENNSPEFPDEAIRRFLFGRLSPAEQTSFEEHLFTDGGLEARVGLAEFDLADDYALERLSAADREAFEEKFLLSAERKRQLKVSTVLRDRFASISTGVTTAPDAKASISERLLLLFGFNQRAKRLVFGAAALAVLVAAAWLIMKELPLRRAIDPPPIVRSSPSPSSKRETQHPPGPASPPEHHISPSPMPPHEPANSSASQTSPAVASVFLMPMPNLPPHGFWVPEVNLSRNERDILRLQLSVEADDSGTYQVEILTSDGRIAFSAESLKPTQAAAATRIAVDIPAGALRTGQYEVRLTRVNGFEPGMTTFYFRVR